MDDCSRAVTLSFRCTQGSGFQVQAGRENVPEPSAVTRGVSHLAEAARPRKGLCGSPVRGVRVLRVKSPRL